MKYDEIRSQLASGDVLLCKRRGIVSILIRVGTAETFNHAAMIIRQHGGVFVVEMREGKGWQMMPASEWMEVNKKAEVYWGKAPLLVRGSYCIEDYALKARGTRYSYWTLFTVWLSQLFNKKTIADMVCSTFVQKGFETCGHPAVDKSYDPSDLMADLRDINRITN